MNTLINSKLPEFKAQVYQNEAFRTVTNKDIEGKMGDLLWLLTSLSFVQQTCGFI